MIVTNLQLFRDLVHSLFQLEFLAQISQVHIAQQSGSFNGRLTRRLFQQEKKYTHLLTAQFHNNILYTYCCADTC